MSVNSATHPNKLFLTKFKPNELSTILRDLGNHEKLNVKHLLSDFKENEQQKNEGIGGSNRRNHGKKRSKKRTHSGYGTTHSGYGTTPVGCRGGNRYVEGDLLTFGYLMLNDSLGDPYFRLFNGNP